MHTPACLSLVPTLRVGMHISAYLPSFPRSAWECISLPIFPGFQYPSYLLCSHHDMGRRQNPRLWRGVAGGMQTRIFAGDGLNVLAGERVRLVAGPCTYAIFDDADLDVPDPETVTYEYNTANESEHSRDECVARQAFSAENAGRVTKMRIAWESPRARSHACRRTRLAWYSPRFPRRTVSKYQGDGSVTHAECTWFAAEWPALLSRLPERASCARIWVEEVV